MGCAGMASRTAGIVTVLFVLSFALLASGSPPTADTKKAPVAMTQAKMADMKAHVLAKKQVHMLAEEKEAKAKQEEATTQKKASDEGGEEVVGMMGIKYKRTKEEAEMAKHGPSFADIWKIREFVARCFGYALVAGILFLILACCFTQRGCFVYDKFIDKDPYYNRVDEAAETKP